MNKFLLFIFFITFQNVLKGQHLHIESLNFIADTSMQFNHLKEKTKDDGQIVVFNNDYNYYNGENFQKEISVKKYSRTKRLQWTDSWKMNDTVNYQVSTIRQTKNGEYILIGSYWDWANPKIKEDYHGQTDVWITRLSKEGKILWSKCYGGFGRDGGLDIIEVDNGFIAFCAIEEERFRYYVINISEKGDVIWDKKYGEANGRGQDNGKAMFKTKDNNILLIGNSSSLDQNHHNKIWFIKIDFIGNILWQETIESDKTDDILNIIPLNDNSFTIIGQTSSTAFKNFSSWKKTTNNYYEYFSMTLRVD